MLHFNKKAFRALVLCLLSIIPSITSTAYVPAAGPLKLGDSYTFLGNGIERGIIMKTIINDPELIYDKPALYLFLTNIPYGGQLPLYQDIISNLTTSTNNLGAIKVLETFEKAIMKLVHYEKYMYYTEGNLTNIFFTGIQKPSMEWFQLAAAADTTQLMQELKQLAQVAKRHSLALSFRLNQKADSYLYWKTRMLKTLVTLGTIGTLYYYKDDIRNSVPYTTGKNLINSGKDLAQYLGSKSIDTARYLDSAGRNTANYISSTGSSLINTGTNFAQYVGTTGKDAANYIGSTGQQLFNTSTDWAQYLGSKGISAANYIGSYLPTKYPETNSTSSISGD